jgi:metal-responsive CopG/Arc/MetJ family transcriptional regulator
MNKTEEKRGINIKRTGIAIDHNVLDAVQIIANYERRSRNNMIEHMLREQIAEYRARKKGTG